MQQENIVKRACKELGVTQKELAEMIGAAEPTVRNWAAGKEVPEWAKRSIDLIEQRKKDSEIIDTAKKLLKLLSER